MIEDSRLPFDLPAVKRKKVSAEIEAGVICSRCGLVLLRDAKRCLGLAETLTAASGTGEIRRR